MTTAELIEMDRVFNPSYPISREARSRIKHAISTHPGWPHYRQTVLTGFNLNHLNKPDLYATCSDLGLDIWRLIFDAPITKPDFPDDNPFEHRPPVTHAISIGGLAERLGVPRQRVYNMVKRGWIKAEPMGGTLIIQSDEANRVIEAAMRVDTRMGSRIVFNFI